LNIIASIERERERRALGREEANEGGSPAGERWWGRRSCRLIGGARENLVQGRVRELARGRGREWGEEKKGRKKNGEKWVGVWAS
jgi:hypothetical protein